MIDPAPGYSACIARARSLGVPWGRALVESCRREAGLPTKEGSGMDSVDRMSELVARMRELDASGAPNIRAADIVPLSDGERCFVALASGREALLPEGYGSAIEAWFRLPPEWRAGVCAWRGWPEEWAWGN